MFQSHRSISTVVNGPRRLPWQPRLVIHYVYCRKWNGWVKMAVNVKRNMDLRKRSRDSLKLLWRSDDLSSHLQRMRSNFSQNILFFFAPNFFCLFVFFCDLFKELIFFVANLFWHQRWLGGGQNYISCRRSKRPCTTSFKKPVKVWSGFKFLPVHKAKELEGKTANCSNCWVRREFPENWKKLHNSGAADPWLYIVCFCAQNFEV